MSRKLDQFLSKLNYNFKNQSLLDEALTHPSYSNSRSGSTVNYQRLEFLGDTVLSMVIAEMILRKYPKDNEGQLSKRQAYLVNGQTLAGIALEIGLGEAMFFSKNEENNSGRTNKRNLENGLEALIGAIYLDSNLDECKNFIKRYWDELMDHDLVIAIDPVSHLQEITQARSKKLPKYQTSKTGGNEHEPIFTAVVEIDGQRYAANGGSKKEAQKKAAKYAIDMITSPSDN